MAAAPRSLSPLLAGLLAVLAIVLLVVPAQATDAYCSSQNTAPGDTYYNWPYQSNGNCTNHCNEQPQAPYAFAVLQFKDCWCSNIVPGQTTDKGKCQKSCPGFPDDKCGDKDAGLYLYLQLDGKPSSTAGGSKPTSTIVSSAAPPPSSSRPPAPVSSSTVQTPSSAPSRSVSSVEQFGTTTTTHTVFVKPSAVITAFSSYSYRTSTKQSSQPPPTTISSASPQTSLMITSDSNGGVVTRIIVLAPSSAPTTSQAPVKSEPSDSQSNLGAIVGGAVGGAVLLIAVVGGILFFLWRRRKQQRQMEDGMSPAGIGGGSTGITRNTSTMSSAGLLGRGTGNTSQYPPPVATTWSTANSRYGDQESISPISNHRNSQPLVIDSRLNPNTIIAFANANASRDSLASIDDSRDYGRQLNVRNPDP